MWAEGIWPCDLGHFACEVLGSCFLFLTLLLSSHEVERFREVYKPSNPKPLLPPWADVLTVSPSSLCS